MAGFRAGAARSCITPELGCHICGYFRDRIAEDIHDDLHAKALVLENDDTALARPSTVAGTCGTAACR